MTTSPPWVTRAFLFAAALLVVAEMVARWGFASSVEGRFEYGFHPTAGFVESPAGRVQLVRSGGRRFFPQDYPLQRPPGTFRIFVLGDSVPRGTSVDQSYGGRLGALLRSRGTAVEVWNLCVPGYGVRRVQTTLKQALHYSPSLVVLHLNNSNEYEDEREFRRSQEFASWHPKNWLMKSFLFRRLYEAKTEQLTWKLLPESVRARQGVNDADAEIAASMSPTTLRQWEERVSEETRRSVSLCAAQAVPMVLVTQATLSGPVGSRSLHDAGLGALAQSLTNREVSEVSMLETFRETDVANLYADANHLKPPGHQRMADALLRVIDAKELLESRSARHENSFPLKP